MACVYKYNGLNFNTRQELENHINNEINSYTENQTNGLLGHTLQNDNTVLTPDGRSIPLINENLLTTIRQDINGQGNIQDVGQLSNRNPVRQNGGTLQEQATTTNTQSADALRQNEDIRQFIIQTRERINEEEEIINEIEEPLHFTNSDVYKRYLNLLNKENRTDEEEVEMNSIGATIDNWVNLVGISADGAELTDVIKQLNHLINTQQAQPAQTKEVDAKTIEEDINRIDGVSKNNFAYGLNFNSVFSKVVGREGSKYIEVSGLTLEGFKNLIPSIDLEDRVTTDTDKRTIIIPFDVATEINNSGLLRIGSPLASTGTFYSLVLAPITNDQGVTKLEPVKSDYENNINQTALDNIKEGDSVKFSIDFSNEWNQNILNKAMDELDRKMQPSDSEKKRLIKEEQNKLISEDKQILTLNKRIGNLESKKKLKGLSEKEDIKLIESKDKLKGRVKELNTKAENNINSSLSKTNGKSLSIETRNQIINELNISITNNEGEAIQTLKGNRINSNTSKDSDYNRHVSLREEILSDIDAILDSYSLRIPYTTNATSEVSIKQYLPGQPDLFLSPNEDGSMSTVPQVITEDMLEKIHDVGYIENGKINTKNRAKNIITSFVKTPIDATKGDNKTKIPVVIIKKGEHLIAYPVTVVRDQAPYTIEDFENIYNNSSMTEVDKAMELNTMLAELGFDVTQKDNSFIVMGNSTTLTDERFNNILDRIRGIDYISYIDDWINKSTTIRDNLLGRAFIDLNMNGDLFVSPKIMLDYSKINVKDSAKVINDNSKKQAIEKEVENSVVEELFCR